MGLYVFVSFLKLPRLPYCLNFVAIVQILMPLGRTVPWTDAECGKGDGMGAWYNDIQIKYKI